MIGYNLPILMKRKENYPPAIPGFGRQRPKRAPPWVSNINNYSIHSAAARVKTGPSGLNLDPKNDENFHNKNGSTVRQMSRSNVTERMENRK